MYFPTRIWAVLLVICFSVLKLVAAEDQQVISYLNSEQLVTLSESIYIYEDTNRALDFAAVKHMPFSRNEKQGMINFGFSRSNIWLKFTINNQTDIQKLYLMLSEPAIDRVSIYTEMADGTIRADTLGQYRPFWERYVDAPDYIFPIDVKTNTAQTFYMLVSSNDQIQLPLFLGTEALINKKNSTKSLLFGLYAGAILIMMIYNLFLSISTKGGGYTFYIIYILFVGLTQAMFQGYAFMYLWPGSPWMARYSSVIIPVLSGLSTIAFIRTFLKTKRNAPKLDRGIDIVIILYLVGLVIGLVNIHFGAMFLQTMASIGIIYVLYVINQIRRSGHRPAKFIFIAFSLFFLSVILFVLRNFNVLPYNNFTSHILEIGSIVEISLLSFALADRINFYRRAKEKSQAQALRVFQKNAQIIREQNVLLETEVNKRTADLLLANQSLEEAMTDLKQTQTQLVESEKLASLGMLTAGIAHEINNPINFVTASVKPLSRDVDQIIEAMETIEGVGLSDQTPEQKAISIAEYKEEIDYDYLRDEINLLLKGIEEGAMRTAEIVKSLRVFSRVDEDDLKFADVNLGLESTLVIINSLYKEKIEVIRDFGDIPYIECFPSKLNQVFLNLLTNAIHAVDEKFQGAPGGRILVSTSCDDQHVLIKVTDNGVGIKEDLKTKIFDPFFTTKDVGEGTGLGLAIVSQTIIKHNGDINFVSDENVGGCEFIITLPITQPSVLRDADTNSVEDEV
ncbi:sensor histidine kinase [Parapedobacter lycopersici]|uniref:sensor histidine kinase n=1 Tax=Parapedobacter lycopersici TaxID=1864939 RepID=UPI00214DDFF2|nr:7TM diverse intracellular signaling domain-containing protein [Parapedobacter lycopersici]